MKIRVFVALVCLGAQPALADEKVFLEAWKRVNTTFYDKNMRGVDWSAVRDELLPAARAAQTPEETSAVINKALGRLGVSHTAHFVPSQRAYWELVDVFYPRGVPADEPGLGSGPVSFVGAGVATKVIDGKVFAADVYDACPAAAAGLLVGDELIAVDGKPWSDVDAFKEKEGRPVAVTIRRTKDGPTSTVTLTPQRLQPQRTFLRALKGSAKVIEKDGKQIGYVRVRSYANESYQRRLAKLLDKELKDCDALVLDLRAGWGGAQAKYMELFGSLVPNMVFRERGADWSGPVETTSWKKPMVVLIDSDSRSGKEMLAYAFKAMHRATLVGTKTRGAVLGGRGTLLSDGSLLLVAVSDVRVDGQILEGHGVEPDITVERPIPYCRGNDPQLQRGVEVAVERLRRSGT